MSVSTHLAINLAEYDARIRTFIPDYEEMLDVVAHVVALHGPRRVIDLGTGTGALAARVSAAVPAASLLGIDEDAGMLGMAARRLRRRRVTFQHENFLTAALPSCQAVVASFALHHVERPRVKGAFYRRVYRALRRGGIFVSADCYPASLDSLSEDGRRAWLAHLRTSYGAKQGAAFLQAWAKEDFYTTIALEERLLRSAGFQTEIVWRRNPFAVIVAGREARPVQAVSAPRTPNGRFRRRGGHRGAR